MRASRRGGALAYRAGDWVEQRKRRGAPRAQPRAYAPALEAFAGRDEVEEGIKERIIFRIGI
ncbi:MAG: hypothetical protein WC659_04430 [Patescibacteria group bacterium]